MEMVDNSDIPLEQCAENRNIALVLTVGCPLMKIELGESLLQCCCANRGVVGTLAGRQVHFRSTTPGLSQPACNVCRRRIASVMFSLAPTCTRIVDFQELMLSQGVRSSPRLRCSVEAAAVEPLT